MTPAAMKTRFLILAALLAGSVIASSISAIQSQRLIHRLKGSTADDVYNRVGEVENKLDDFLTNRGSITPTDVYNRVGEVVEQVSEIKERLRNDG